MGKLTHNAWVVARTAQAIVRMVRDPERTAEAHVVEELTSVGAMREYLVQHEHEKQLYQLLARRPELSSQHIDFAALRQLGENTLGRSYVQHLDDNGLTADSQATPTRYVDDDEISYLIRRFRQTHDVWHTLACLGIAVHEEIAIHAFSWGQLRLPISKLTVLFGGLRYVLLEGRYQMARQGMWGAYKSGRQAEQLLPVIWEDLWDEPIDQLRERFHIRPCPLELART